MKILAVTCMRNEGPYCLEWIAHHRAAGINDFLIFTHDCLDDTAALLDLVDGVTHVPFSPDAGSSVQWQALRLADKHPLMKNADWVLFFDCDEFLCLSPPLHTVPQLILSLPENTDAIALPWRLFGSAGHTDWLPGLVTERFDQAAPPDLNLPAGYFFKTLFRPEKFQKLGIHRPKTKAGTMPQWSIAGTYSAPEAFCKNDKRINLFGLPAGSGRARLNHYSTKSVSEFMIKRARGLPNRRQKNIDLSYWAERNFNTVQNRELGHMQAQSKTVLNRFFECPALYKRHEKSRATHQALLQSLMQEPENIMLFLHLTLLQSSIPPTKEQIETHLARLRAAQ